MKASGQQKRFMVDLRDVPEDDIGPRPRVGEVWRNNYWVTKDKRQLAIWEMTDSHIANTVALLDRRIKSVEEELALTAEDFSWFDALIANGGIEGHRAWLKLFRREQRLRHYRRRERSGLGYGERKRRRKKGRNVIVDDRFIGPELLDELGFEP